MTYCHVCKMPMIGHGMQCNTLLGVREELELIKRVIATKAESDSPIASCECQAKSPDIQHHKPGCKYRLIMERDEARRDNEELRALFYLQWTRMTEATKLWQEATGRRDVHPDLGELLTWLLEQRARPSLAVMQPRNRSTSTKTKTKEKR